MEYWRVTEVWAIGSQGPGRVGSGYLISERRVLTARHVLAGILHDPGTCEVRCTGQTEWIPATLAWSNEDLDAALLELTGSLAGRVVEPMSWGRIVGDQPVDCTAVGFPDAQSRADQVRDTEQIDGRILPLSTLRANRLTVQVRGNAPTALASGDTPWHGMSVDRAQPRGPATRS